MLSASRNPVWRWVAIVVALLVLVALMAAFFLSGTGGTGKPAAESSSASSESNTAPIGPTPTEETSQSAAMIAILPAKPMPDGLTLTGPGTLSAQDQAQVDSDAKSLTVTPTGCLPLLPVNQRIFRIAGSLGQALYLVKGPGLTDDKTRAASGTITEYADLAATDAKMQEFAAAMPACGNGILVTTAGVQGTQTLLPQTVETPGVQSLCYNLQIKELPGRSTASNELICHLRSQNVIITVMETSNTLNPSAEVLAQWTSLVKAQASSLAKLAQ